MKTLATPVRRVLLLGIANRAEGTNCRLVYLTVFVLVVLSIVEFSGCSGARLTGVTATLKLTANPTDLSFSNVTVGRTSSQNVTLTNLGDSSVTISRVTVSGAGFSAGGLTSTDMLTAGNSVVLTVTFSPTSAGSATGSVTITGDATNSPANISLSGSGVQGTSDATIPSTFFGMYAGVQTPYSTPILAPVVVGATGKGVVTAWMYTETSRGIYAWGALDKVVGFAKNHNVPVFQSHAYEPQWAVSDTTNCFPSAIPGISKCPAPPSDLTTITACQGSLTGLSTTDCMWKEYLTSMVNRYRTSGTQTGCTTSNPQCNGVIQMYEGWNEPRGANPMSLANFTTLETDFLNTVRANDTGAKVCSPAFIIDPTYPSYVTFMNDFFAEGGPKTFDCYDFHINEPNPEAQITDINQFKSILSSNGIDPSSATIYATEAGRWGGCGVVISGMSEQAYIGRIELLYWSNGIQRHYWYAYDACGTLINRTATQTLNSAGIGYGNVESWMVGATMSTPCAARGTVWTCGLSRPEGYQALAVWNTAATSTILPPSQYTQYRDLEGNTHSISGSVTIGTEPILLISYGAASAKTRQ